MGWSRLRAALVCAALALAVSCSGKEEVDNRKPVRLNEYLTNELSDTSDLAGLDKKIKVFMQEWQLQGCQLAVMRNDSLLYAKGYGWADKEKEVSMEPSHIMRIASVSKLITATGIMLLQEEGKLSLRDTVFGPGGILNDSLYTKAVKDKNIFKITVEDLLRHKAGFIVTGAGDPMFSTRTIMRVNKLEKVPDHETLVRIELGKKLGYVPGTSQSYSNFGFLLLSMIIEKVTGEDYEDWVRENVLEKALCQDFKIANNYYKDKYKEEVRYYVPSNEPTVQEYNNSGKQVVRCYGGNDIRALSGAGAWVGSIGELARFVASIDGLPSVADIISAESVAAMTEYIDEDTYSLGWNDTDPEKGWKRTGTFSGTAALIMYFPDGECWLFLTNTSTWKGPRFQNYTLQLFRDLKKAYQDKFPKRDFFFE